MFVTIWTVAFAQTHDRPEVLGLNRETGAVALRRHVGMVGGASPIDCKYKGHAKEGGVRLRLESSDADATWEVYDTAFEPGECTPHATSVERLDAAKAAFAKAGIDIATPPAVEWLSRDAGFEAPIDGVRVTREVVRDDPWATESARQESLRRLDAPGAELEVTTEVARISRNGKAWITHYGDPETGGFRPLGVLRHEGATWVLFLTEHSMWAGAASEYHTVRVDTLDTPPVVIDRPVHPLPEGVVSDVLVQDLDPERGLAAVKLVSSLKKPSKRIQDCEYAGMKDPRHGVTLGIWDLEVGGLREGFEIYAPVSDARGCSKVDVSSAALAKAKERAAASGLDLKDAPMRHSLEPGLTVEGRAVAMESGVLMIDGKAAWTSPSDAEVLSLWSRDGTLVVVYTTPGEVAGQRRSHLSPLL